MKTILTILLALAATTAGYAQGLININNCDSANHRTISYAPGGPNPGGKIDGMGHLVYANCDFGGANARLGVYVGPAGCAEDQLILLAPAVVFRSGVAAGCINCGTSCYRSLASLIAPDAMATVQLRAWDAGVTGVETYEDAALYAQIRGVYLGKSAVTTIAPSGYGTPLPPPTPLIIPSFSIYWTASEAPVIATQPQSQTACQGTTASFSVTVSGTAQAYQWKCNGTDVPGGTAQTLSLTNVNPSDAGNYTVVVTNFAGSVTSQVAVLTVRTPPLITTQPLSQTVTPGTNVSFSVAATGTGPLSYQWWFAGAVLPGQIDPVLSLSDVQTTNSGNYWVVVSNACGTATSQPASLAIPPELDLFMVPGVMIKGTVGFNYLLEYSNEAGPTNVWTSLATVTLTNVQQFYFDTSAIGKPSRCYRARQAPQ